MARWRADPWACGILAGLVGLALALLASRAFSPESRLLDEDPRAPWIAPGAPVSARLQQWGRREAPRSVYVARFTLPELTLPATLELRAFGSFAVELNGEAVVVSPVSQRPADRAWQRFTTLEVGRFLRTGPNEIRVEVRNLHGPPLLSLRLEGRGFELASGPHWSVQTDAAPAREARLASDVRRHPDAGAGERPLAALAARAPLVALLFALGALAGAAAHGREAPRGLPRAVFAGVALAWLALFVTTFRAIPLDTGFDAGHHGLYLERLRETARLPLATDGWSSFHPPLFYALAALLAELGEAVGGERGAVLGAKALPFLCGLGLVALSGALARRLRPERRSAAVWALLCAGFLPLNLYTAAYFSNEGLHALLGAGALLVAVELLLAERLSLARSAALSVLLGLALLTKFTALVVAPLALVAVGTRWLLAERGRPRALAAGIAALALPALLVAGWFYARNLLAFGHPVVGNWNLPGEGLTWWSAPGFHTSAYYLHFGEALKRPFFSAFVSFADALYSTLFGDGLLGGRASLGARHPYWDYGWMAAGYALALPALAVLALGALRALGAALADADPRRRAANGLALALLGALGFAILYSTLLLPFFGQARAGYALAGVPVLALLFADGAGALARVLDAPLGRLGSALLWGYAAALFGGFYWSFAG